MKKKMLLVPILALLMTVSMVVGVNAASVDIDLYSDDDMYSHIEGGMSVLSNFVLTFSDAGDDPYGYGVDTSKVGLKSDFSGGYMLMDTQRTDSASKYGDPGQRSYSFVGCSGDGSLDFTTTVNFANLYSSNYGFQANSQFTATGRYTIQHQLWANPDEYGDLQIEGDGSINVDYMTDGYTNSGGFRFGWGDGCYENADFTATGDGLATLYGQADNNLSAHDGSWSESGDGVWHLEQWGWSDGTITVDDYAFSGN